jgi:hypothetical protein
VLTQLAARAKGHFHDVLDGKLKEKLPPAPKSGDDETIPVEDRDQHALLLHDGRAVTERLDEAITNKLGESVLIALCRSTPTAALQVSQQPPLVTALMEKLALGPEVAFNAKVPALLAMPGLHDWMFAQTPATAILAGITEANAPVVAASLNDADRASPFLKGLPKGRGLTAAQKAKLHQLSLLVDDPRQRALFGIVFDTPIGTLSRAEIEKTWRILERLPEAHVDQHSISGFLGTENKLDNGTVGVYKPDTQDIELQKGNLEKQVGGAYDHKVRMSEDEAIEALGSRDDLARFVAENRVKLNADGTYSFVQEGQINVFPQTVLHEVGHAVDYMLGAQTDFIYQQVDWKRFSISDFDRWAIDLGGWDKVRVDDQGQIRELWISWLNAGSSGAVADMVDRDHPINAREYRSVGVVELAHNGLPERATPIGHRAAMAVPGDQLFYSLSLKGYNAAPSAYSLTAPAEYFAECYAFYYRAFDGTPNTTPTKGDSLAPWIKRWFDANVDRVGHNPHR